MNFVHTLGGRLKSRPADDTARPITPEESDFISLARIVMIVALVFHHVFSLPGSEFDPRNAIDPNTAHIADYLNSMIHWIAMASVPCLSVISGYLFFKRSRIAYLSLLHRRFFTVVLPSIAWTTFWFFFAYLIFIWGQGTGYFRWIDYGFEQIGPELYLDGALGISRLPYAYQFWFVHDLVLTFILTPVIGWFTARAPWILLAVLGSVWALNIDVNPFFSINVLFFFSLGSVSATTRFDLSWSIHLVKRLRWIVSVSFVAVLLGRMFKDHHDVLGSYLYLCLLRGAGLLAVILLISSLTLRNNFWLRVLRYLSPFSFFVFAFHYPTLEFIKAAARKFPGFDSEMGMIAMFFMVPLTCVVISLTVAVTLRWLFPRIFSFINGGRATGEKSPGYASQSAVAPAG